MKPWIPLLVLFLSVVSASGPAMACDFCMLGQGVNPYLTAKGRGLTLDTLQIESDHVYDKATEISSNGKSESWMIYTLTGFYPVSDELTLLLALPYSVKTNLDFDPGSNTNPGVVTTGLDDITLTGRYTLFKEHSFDSTLLAGFLGGIKFPTGSTSLHDMSGAPVDRHALPGTGSFDFNVGFTGTYATAGGFQLTADVVDVIPTTGDWDGQPHRYGNALNFSLKGYYRVLPRQPEERSLMPFVGVSGEWMGRETGYFSDDSGYVPDAANESSGGTVLFADIGIYAVTGPSTVLNLGVSKAFYRYMYFDPAFDADPAENTKIDFSITYLL